MANDFSDIISALTLTDEVTTLFLDVHPALKMWGEAWMKDDRDIALKEFIERLLHHTHVRTLILVSNGPIAEVTQVSSEVRVLTRQYGNKPWKAFRLHEEFNVDSGRTAVCGDQELTDGLLAWLWACAFIHFSVPVPSAPRRVRILRMGSRLVRPMGLFRPGNSTLPAIAGA